VPAFTPKPESGLKVVDTTGAGDTFTAAYALSLSQEFASAAAFLCITKLGAANAMPKLEEVNAIY